LRPRRLALAALRVIPLALVERPPATAPNSRAWAFEVGLGISGVYPLRSLSTGAHGFPQTRQMNCSGAPSVK
jgi:hypothetical protein